MVAVGQRNQELHFEWLHADKCDVKFLPRGYDINTGEPATDATTDQALVSTECALVIRDDDIVVIGGSLEGIRKIVVKVVQEVGTGTEPVKPSRHRREGFYDA